MKPIVAKGAAGAGAAVAVTVALGAHDNTASAAAKSTADFACRPAASGVRGQGVLVEGPLRWEGEGLCRVDIEDCCLCGMEGVP